MMKIAKVYLIDALFHIDKEYSYEVPIGIDAKRGSILLVPFGRGNSPQFAVATEVFEESAIPDFDIKCVYSAAEDRYSLDEDMLLLADFLKRNTLCTFGSAVRAMIPPAVFSSYEEFILPTEKEGFPKNENAISALTLIREEGVLTLSRLKKLYGADSKRILSLLKKSAFVTAYCEITPPHNIKYKTFFSYNGADISKLRSGKMKSIIDFLSENGEGEANELCEIFGDCKAQLASLVKRKTLEARHEESYRSPYKKVKRDTSEIILSSQQLEAEEKLTELYSEEKPRAALLFGVTGSGKTKVILKLIDKAIADKKGVIMLVPEISLTPQTVGIFAARYGERIAVIHSSLSAGERFDQWRRIKNGDVDLVIGTRSAIFAPIKNLGLIVIDEEHEHTYKSDSDPKYSTKEVAAFRCGSCNSLLVLASATPSVESFYKAKNGTYTLIEMTQRYGTSHLPDVSIIDMREELCAGNTSPVSRKLYEKLTERRKKGEQSILFLNRRGYSSSLHCKDCGYVFECPQCSIALTYHIDRGGYLSCHCCGHKSAVPHTCPSCGGDKISYLGFGTQKAEGELSQIIEGASIMRMDADTTSGKSSYEKMLTAFRRGDADILLGTQMVTKGHDFPNVTLVGIMLADLSLYINDFRARERTFSMLTQVIGRAGRSELPGEAVIQTFSPNSDIIRLAKNQDYKAFYEAEIAERKTLLFPPFCDIITLTLTSENEAELKAYAEKLQGEVVAFSKDSEHPIILFGPFEAVIYKMNGKFRMKMLLKTKLNNYIRKQISDLLLKFTANPSIHLSVDINPTDT